MTLNEDLSALWGRSSPIRRKKATEADVILFIYVSIRTSFLYPDKWKQITNLITNKKILPIEKKTYIQFAPTAFSRTISHSLCTDTSDEVLEIVHSIFKTPKLTEPVQIGEVQ